MSDLQLIENEDYELIPNENDGWDIRILKGDYVETVFTFGKIVVMENEEGLTFDFEIVSTPDPDLTPEIFGLQKYAGSVLYDIITRSVNEERVVKE